MKLEELEGQVVVNIQCVICGGWSKFSYPEPMLINYRLTCEHCDGAKFDLTTAISDRTFINKKGFKPTKITELERRWQVQNRR